MSVTPDVSHVEMWPYVASAAVSSESHAATASRMLLSSIAVPRRRWPRCIVGAGDHASEFGSAESTNQPLLQGASLPSPQLAS